jgi:pyruvate dehydrogenase E2 component (dihydrolipoamide acetyltransferase)
MTEVRMPQKGLTEESAILSKWYVRKGDLVKEGQLLFALETGKAVFDVEAEVSGTVLEIFGGEGEEIAVKAVVCVIGASGEAYVPAETAQGVPKAQEGEPAPVNAAVLPVTAAPPVSAVSAAAFITAAGSPGTEAGKTGVSPRARRLAGKNGLSPGEIAGISGTGPGGRIIEEDVMRAVQASTAARAPGAAAAVETPRPRPEGASIGEYTAVPVGGVRKATAAAMMISLQSMAQYTMTASFDATELLSYRERQAAKGDAGKLSINDLMVFALSRVLPDFPYMNAHYLDREIRHFAHAHIGVAVDTPKGLLVPTVKNADSKSLAAISAEVKDLALRCRSGTVRPEELAGGTFTVTNIGVYGIEYFTPIINPPQTGILGVGKIEYKRKKTGNGMADYPAIGLSLTCDHRAVDGSPAARFLQALSAALENFTLLFVK